MADSEFKKARFAENYTHIIDSDGKRVALDDPRIVIVWPVNHNPYTVRCVEKVFQHFGIRFRPVRYCNMETMQLARELCSGRECIPSNAIAGATLKDIYENRSEDEISIYFNLDQEGPCQNGAWPLIWDTFAERLKLRNAIFCEQHKHENKFLGMGRINFGLRFVCAMILGDLIEEAKHSLLCLAKDKESAVDVFEKTTSDLIRSSRDGVPAICRALTIWSRKIRTIPLRRKIEDTPRVLIFGGLNVLFINEPIKAYLLDQDIIPKVVDLTEGVCWLEVEGPSRYGFKKKLFSPTRQTNILFLIMSMLFGNHNRAEAYHALRRRMNLLAIESHKRIFRKLMEPSGLMIDKEISFSKMLEKGNQFVSFAGFHETTVTTGRYVSSIEEDTFDGYVNLGSFNCQPAINSQAIIRPIAAKNEMPYIALDCEGPWISTNHRRLLETIAVQASRVREKKTRRASVPELRG